MCDYIDRDKILKVIESGANWYYSYNTLYEEAQNIPSADVSPVKHGKWLYKGYVCGDTAYQCSACDEIEWRTSCDRLKYCPFCGAKMDGEDNA